MEMMAGSTGKRAKLPGICIKCGMQITTATFLRWPKGDTHSLDTKGEYECQYERHRKYEVIKK